MAAWRAVNIRLAIPPNYGAGMVPQNTDPDENF
jgi:hypothetical protein